MQLKMILYKWFWQLQTSIISPLFIGDFPLPCLITGVYSRAMAGSTDETPLGGHSAFWLATRYGCDLSKVGSTMAGPVEVESIIKYEGVSKNGVHLKRTLAVLIEKMMMNQWRLCMCSLFSKKPDGSLLTGVDSNREQQQRNWIAIRSLQPCD